MSGCIATSAGVMSCDRGACCQRLGRHDSHKSQALATGHCRRYCRQSTRYRGRGLSRGVRRGLRAIALVWRRVLSAGRRRLPEQLPLARRSV